MQISLNITVNYKTMPIFSKRGPRLVRRAKTMAAGKSQSKATADVIVMKPSEMFPATPIYVTHRGVVTSSFAVQRHPSENGSHDALVEAGQAQVSASKEFGMDRAGLFTDAM